MAELTATQRGDMQADLGISDDEEVFSNDELDRLYTRADENYELAVYYGYRQLLADANKLFDYSAGMTKMSRSQVRDHLRDMLAFWKDESDATAGQVQFVGALEVPPRDKDEPDA